MTNKYINGPFLWYTTSDLIYIVNGFQNNIIIVGVLVFLLEMAGC